MISIEPAGEMSAPAPASAQIENVHRQHLLCGTPAYYQQWSNGYLVTQTMQKGNVTTQRFIVQLYSTEHLFGHIAQSTLLLSWLQQGQVLECFIDNHGKINSAAQCIRLLYLPAKTGFKSTWPKSCHVFTTICFNACQVLPLFELVPYAACFANMQLHKNTLPLPGNEVSCNQHIQHYLKQLLMPGTSSQSLPQLVNAYAASIDITPVINNKNKRRMNDINLFINAHLSNNYMLSNIARHMQLSTGTIKQVVKNMCNQAVGEFINEMRLQHARHLLHSDTEIHIAEVAMTIGFTPSYFSKAFSRRFGISPGDFQKKWPPPSGI